MPYRLFLDSLEMYIYWQPNIKRNYWIGKWNLEFTYQGILREIWKHGIIHISYIHLTD